MQNAYRMLDCLASFGWAWSIAPAVLLAARVLVIRPRLERLGEPMPGTGDLGSLLVDGRYDGVPVREDEAARRYGGARLVRRAASAEIELAPGMLRRRWALIIPYVASGQIFGIFVLRTFFVSIPQDLVDSGRVDGAGDFGIFWHIVLPLSKPILGTLAILQMLNIKNDFIWPLVTVTKPALRTLTLQLRLMEGELGTEWGLIMAGYTLACVPILVVFALATRPFIQGMTSGAIKV